MSLANNTLGGPNTIGSNTIGANAIGPNAIITKINYIIEDGIDFYSELNSPENETETFSIEKAKTCLITGKILEQNSITLHCNHTFNYISLFNELCRQKTFNINDPFPMRLNETKCPYCRQITRNILPFIPSLINELIKGVNTPSIYCMKFKSCDYVFKYGHNKGYMCSKNGFESVHGNICEKHYMLKENALKKRLKKQAFAFLHIESSEDAYETDFSSSSSSCSSSSCSTPTSHENNINWTNEMQDLYVSSNMSDIRKKLKEKNLPVSGKKKVIIQRLLNAQSS
jgi:hypothetical protein